MNGLKITTARSATKAAAVVGAAALVSALTMPVRSVRAQQTAGSGSAGAMAFYTQQVQPLLDDQCNGCHADSASGGLRLDSYSAMMQGGRHGKVIVAGDADASLLVQAIRRTGKLKMPPRHALSEEQVTTLVAWIKAGAVGKDLPQDDGDDAMPASAATNAGQAVSAPTGSGAAKTDGSTSGSAKLVAVSEPSAGTMSDGDFFENRVRPILADKCLSCHTDGDNGGLALNTREAMVKGGLHGAAMVPGEPEKSLLITAVEQTTALKMPKGGHLTAQQIADMKEWVKRGAVWPKSAPGLTISSTATTGVITAEQRKFWSFQPLKPVAAPEIEDRKWAHWAKTPIDRFVLAKLLAAGLHPAAQADRRTLIRRATFDMWGVPPSDAEVSAFEQDRNPQAWAKVVDRLLASPRYGQRWGRHWLDVARYSEDDVRGLDPKGRGYMPFEGAYRYRDWVIEAFNRDVPYDQFVKMQLAGDQMPTKTAEQRDENLTATTYLGAGPWVWDQAEPVQGRADERNERVDAVSRGLLGMTVACARCHNHKYDPITQRDYYAMVGIFASSTYKEYPVATAAETAEWQAREKKREDKQVALEDYTKAASLSLTDALAAQTAQYMEAAWQVMGKPQKTVEQAAGEAKLDTEVLRRWTSYLGSPVQYPYLKDWKAMVADDGGSEAQAKILAEGFQKTLLEIRDREREIEDENDAIRVKNNVPKHRFVRDAKPSEFETFDQFCPGCELELKALPVDEAKVYSDIFVSRAGDQETRFKPGVLVFRGWELESRLGPAIASYMESQQAEIEGLKKQLDPAKYPYVHGMADKAKAMDVRLNLRGNPHSLGSPVPRRFLTVLTTNDPAPYRDGSGRLDLADDIVASPLAARVIVNRVWKWHFGSGIVDTPDNFGIVGDAPSDEPLLNDLAYEFVQQGESIKTLQREILLSAVYQESAEEAQEAREKDGANRLYSHFNRQRLDAEELRDAALEVAGDLNWKKDSGPSEDFGADNTARTVYCKVSRFRLNNYLQVFDFPNPSFTAEQRFASNVPLQQLYFMNNPFIFRQAGVLADRVENEPNDQARIVKMYEYVYQRKPSEAEIKLAQEFLHTTPEKAGYAVVGEPITAWKQYARILLSSNEFLFID